MLYGGYLNSFTLNVVSSPETKDVLVLECINSYFNSFQNKVVILFGIVDRRTCREQKGFSDRKYRAMLKTAIFSR